METEKRVGHTFAASAGTPYAAEAAAEVYRAGGNAADAAVAAAAAVSVTEPLMSSIGGGGFALVRTPSGDPELIDYFDVMPGKDMPESLIGAGGRPQTIRIKLGAGVDSIIGGPSVAVPGSVKGWEMLLERHGRLSLKEVLKPAARLARDGFLLCKNSADYFLVADEALSLTGETRRNFFKSTSEGERVYHENEEMRFPDLADTFDAVGEGGSELFYRGDLSRRITAYIQEMGGLVSERDMAEYQPTIREPLVVEYGSGLMFTNAPPSAGGATLAQMLKVVSDYDLDSLSPEEYGKIVGGAMRYALRDREVEYGDEERNLEVARRLTTEEYARAQRRKIFGSSHTSHLSCVDSDGLAVAITASMGYGSGLVVPGTGIPLGNTLGEPELNPRGFHALKPGEKLISSMSPTVVSSEKGGLICLGSPGATRIPSAILQAIINVIDFGMPLESAVLFPRIHSEFRPGGKTLFAYEAGARKSELDGFDQVLNYEGPNMYFGGVNAVRLTPEGTFEAAADPRRSGGSAFV
ncbi:gamma-glutamyltransferase family protein [Rubrobacter indicoceani]|uniref:gamma-glutamyltransferase family protein n=1 Tax=Rubrobacter indicoceani TaxID=2051957 RepID=UPI000E5A29AA|nr:gamma-glutamyltransferase [Rubrobacter indicoceani]